MADEGFQPGQPGAPQGVPRPESGPAEPARTGGPGRPSDVIPLSRVPVSRPVNKPSEPEMKDNFREVIETIVFVVVLVLMLKTFLAEAFVIPTGSMATTLLGYHKDVTCEQCNYEFRVNASSEAEPQEGRPLEEVGSADCPNCRYRNTLRNFRGARP